MNSIPEMTSLAAIPLNQLAALLDQSDDGLSYVDAVVINLVVAQSIPQLAHVDISLFVSLADDWAENIRRALPSAELHFQRSPNDWKGDLSFFRLGVLCWYIDEILGIRYREDQQHLQSVCYTDPSDLFLNGVMESRRGTCGNMPVLHVALAWRLGWPVSLALAGWHILCRYDDGQRTYNIEATNNGQGGFHSHPDSYYQEQYGLSNEAIFSGSDLKSLKSKELLGLFVGLRARHWEDTGRYAEAARDYRLAHTLFIASRLMRQKAKETAHWGLVANIKTFGSPFGQGIFQDRDMV